MGSKKEGATAFRTLFTPHTRSPTLSVSSRYNDHFALKKEGSRLPPSAYTNFITMWPGKLGTRPLVLQYSLRRGLPFFSLVPPLLAAQGRTRSYQPRNAGQWRRIFRRAGLRPCPQTQQQQRAGNPKFLSLHHLIFFIKLFLVCF